eukprot:PhM_4_TR1285/c2_g4_i7/m.7116
MRVVNDQEALFFSYFDSGLCPLQAFHVHITSPRPVPDVPTLRSSFYEWWWSMVKMTTTNMNAQLAPPPNEKAFLCIDAGTCAVSGVVVLVGIFVFHNRRSARIYSSPTQRGEHLNTAGIVVGVQAMLEDMRMTMDDIVAVMADCHICNLQALDFLSGENDVSDDDDVPAPTTFADLPLYKILREQVVDDASEFNVSIHRKLHLGWLAHAVINSIKQALRTQEFREEFRLAFEAVKQWNDVFLK